MTIDRGRRGRACLLFAALCVGATRVLAQTPAEPAPTAAELAARLQKMEALNQALLKEFQGVKAQLKDYQAAAKQNEALSKQAQELTKRLDASKSDGDDAPFGGPIRATGAGGNGRGGASGTDTSPIGAGVGGGTQEEPRANQTRLRSFYDQDYKNRYGYVFQSRNDEFELRVNSLVQATRGSTRRTRTRSSATSTCRASACTSRDA